MLVGLLVASGYSPVLSTAGLCRDPLESSDWTVDYSVQRSQ